MREVDVGVYKADNGFKPGWLHFLEEKMRASCLGSEFKAKPHIESRVKTLKKDWTTVHDILTSVRHGCSSFGYDNGTNTIVASDDVWVDYIKNFPEAGKWRGKRFYYYDECCYIFGNDRATEEEAHSTTNYLDPANEFVSDLSDSESGGPNTVNVADSSGIRPVRSETPEATSKGRKQLFSDSRTTIGEYMLQAAEVMAVEIGKSTIEIAKAILDDKDRREAVVATLEEVYGIPPIKRAIYATKLAKGNKLMVEFLSLDPTYRLAWLQRMFPNVMYIAPEYAENGIVSVRTDVYAYGVVLLQLISGRKVFELYREEQDQALKQWLGQRVKTRRGTYQKKRADDTARENEKIYRDVATLVEGDVKIEIKGDVKNEIEMWLRAM
ncbi:hypothetical protein Sjap_021514 [Stephania japonica]|uniref:Myb/SANT-like domain-containing protein n=1 Tax=Stephania japonica TaxID=461633 RepID=A0AAP0ESE0_9MAGN